MAGLHQNRWQLWIGISGRIGSEYALSGCHASLTPKAEYQKGEAYAFGKGVPKNYKKAVYWFRKAATRGNVGAKRVLATGYLVGMFGMTKNHTKALYWAKQISPADVAATEYLLGTRQLSHDPKMALYWFKRSAAHGSAPAEQVVGLIYYTGGKGVLQNYSKAVYWLRKAAAQKDGRAELLLGVIHLSRARMGHDVGPNIKQSRYRLMKASAQRGASSAVAKYYLGYIYLASAFRHKDFSQGLPRHQYPDVIYVYKWMLLAKDASPPLPAKMYKKASSQLRMWSRVMSSSQIARAQSLASQWERAHESQQ